MKQIFFSFCLLVFSTFAVPVFAADWNLISQGNSHVFRSVALDGSELLAVGDSGLLFSSTDNGATWVSVATNTSQWLYAVSVGPNGEWFIVGASGLGVVSLDKGKTWSQMNLNTPLNLYSVSVSKEYGFVVGTGGVLYNRNVNAHTWNKVALGVTEDFYKVQDMGDGTGWVVGANGTIFHLFSNGGSYATVNLIQKQTYHSVKFIDEKNGWIVGTSGTVLHTTDGGMTWNPVIVAGVTNQTLYSVDVSGNHVVIAGDKILVISDDGGATWNVKTFADTTKIFYDALVNVDGTAFAVGSDFDVTSLIYKNAVAAVIPPVVVTTVPVPQGEALQSSLIKLACPAHAGVNDPCKAVYYYATDGKRHAFTNDKVYFSWFTDFSTVKEVSAEFLSSLTLGKNVTYRPGVKMVKFQTSPQVYAVAKGGVLRAILTESVAAALYGSDWNKKIDDIADVFYKNYTFGEPIVTKDDFDPAQARILVGSVSENF